VSEVCANIEDEHHSIEFPKEERKWFPGIKE
jgi:hypothetical protein